MNKVLVYVVSNGHLLVNVHKISSEAGVQVPGGTVEENEDTVTAAVRELFEESGLTSTTEPLVIDRYDYFAEWENRVHERTVVLIHDDSINNEPFEHTVSSGELDEGIELSYDWIPIELSKDMLAADHGRSIELISRQ